MPKFESISRERYRSERVAHRSQTAILSRKALSDRLAFRPTHSLFNGLNFRAFPERAAVKAVIASAMGRSAPMKFKQCNGGRPQCQNRFCPYCKKTNERKNERLCREIISGLPTDCHAKAITLDLPTGTGHSLRQLLRVLKSLFTKSKRAKKLMNSLSAAGYIGYISWLHVVRSLSGSWRPHLHLIVFFETKTTDAERSLSQLLEEYQKRAIKNGYDVNFREECKTELWSIDGFVRYLSQGRKEKKQTDGENFFELARKAAGGDVIAYRYVSEFIECMKGQRIVNYSKSLKRNGSKQS